MNASSPLSEDSMTSTPSYLVISLALMQREHQRLDAAAIRLRSRAIPVEQLMSYDSNGRPLWAFWPTYLRCWHHWIG